MSSLPSPVSKCVKRLEGRDRAPKHRRRPLLEVLEDRTVPSSVQGTVFNDLNQNTAFDAGEPGLSGWTVYLDVNRNSVADAGEASVLTGADGNYLIDTTGQPPAWVLDGDEYDWVSVILDVGSGGRWINATPTFSILNRTDEPTALGRNFGAYFQPHVGRAPVGAETLVNVATAGPQGSGVEVAADAQGNFVVAWLSGSGAGRDLVARRFHADGTPDGGEILVATGVSSGPVLARADNGKFTLAWHVDHPTNGTAVVYTRAYAANGTPLTGIVQVTPINKTYRAWVRDIAMDSDGDFAVLYEGAKSSLGGTFWSRGQFGIQLYNNLGQAVGKNTPLIEAPSSTPPGLGMDDAGNFVFVWDDAVNGVTRVLAQRYTSAAKKTGSLIVVATGDYTAENGTHYPLVAMNSSGQFVVNWARGSISQARVYSATGDSLIGPLDVGVKGGVTIDDAGSVTFTGTYVVNPPGQGFDHHGDIAVQHLTAGGVLEPLTLVNTTTPGRQRVSSAGAVAATGNGSFVVVWDGYGAGDDSGVFFQRYEPLAAPLAGSGEDSLSEPAIHAALASLDLMSALDELGGRTR